MEADSPVRCAASPVTERLWQGVGRSEDYSEREAPGRIAVSAGGKEWACGTALGHGQGAGSRSSDSETTRR
jgi:hypothetical protein